MTTETFLMIFGFISAVIGISQIMININRSRISKEIEERISKAEEGLFKETTEFESKYNYRLDEIDKALSDLRDEFNSINSDLESFETKIRDLGDDNEKEHHEFNEILRVLDPEEINGIGESLEQMEARVEKLSKEFTEFRITLIKNIKLVDNPILKLFEEFGKLGSNEIIKDRDETTS